MAWFRQLSVQRAEEKLTIKISGLRTISEITAERKIAPTPSKHPAKGGSDGVKGEIKLSTPKAYRTVKTASPSQSEVPLFDEISVLTKRHRSHFFPASSSTEIRPNNPCS